MQHRLLALVALVVALPPEAGTAEPMDLRDRQARWVSVRFEISPADRPGQVDAVYSPPVAARFEPGEGAHEVRLTVDGRVVEEQLLRNYDPVSGSFSDFVWAFDAVSGHVTSATVSGTVVRVLDWGIRRSRMKVQVRFEMNTRHLAGFRRPRRLMGQRMFPFCAPDGHAECRPAAPSPYDATTGYVNAVGPVDVDTPFKRLRTFSTIGEAVFSEIDPAARERLAALDAEADPQDPKLGR